jgi:hypothetical protein
VVVEGGTLPWNDAGLPVERGTTKAISLECQVRIVAGSLVVIGIVLGYFVHPWLRVCGRRAGLCGDHGFLRHGPASREAALECLQTCVRRATAGNFFFNPVGLMRSFAR